MHSRAKRGTYAERNQWEHCSLSHRLVASGFSGLRPKLLRRPTGAVVTRAILNVLPGQLLERLIVLKLRNVVDCLRRDVQ
jgi:hypothetical protein